MPQPDSPTSDSVVPFGMEEGTEARIASREFGLVVGEPAEFRFLASAGKVFMAAALCLVGLGLHRSVVNRAGVRGMLFGAALWAVSIVTGYVLATIG